LNPALFIADLRVTLGAFTLGPLSLGLEHGDYVVLMGPSGCGKTTLLKTIAGFMLPESGTILLGDRIVTRLAPEERHIGYVPQFPSLFPHLSVRQNIAFGPACRGLAADTLSARVEAVARSIGVGDLLARMPNTLSGGESRRVALARTLATEPAVLLLDEPLSMLDAPARRELAETLRRIQARTGIPTLHVTHHDEEARLVGGNCIQMETGKLR